MPLTTLYASFNQVTPFYQKRYHNDQKVLIYGCNRDTGRAAVKESITLGLDVRAMVHGMDARSEALEKLGAEVVVGDHLEINTVRAAMEGCR